MLHRGGAGRELPGGSNEEPQFHLTSNTEQSPVTLAQLTFRDGPHCPQRRDGNMTDELSHRRTDNGGGIWHWLHEPPDPPHAADVEYIGELGLLQLRGGGVEDDVNQQPNPQNDDMVSSYGAECATCHGKFHHEEDVWAAFLCGHRLCENCTRIECPVCPVPSNTTGRARPTQAGSGSSGPVLHGHVRRMINHFENRRSGNVQLDDSLSHLAWLDTAVGSGQSREGGVRIAPWAKVTGDREGKSVRICPSCGGSSPDDERWRPRRDGLMVCPECYDDGNNRADARGDYGPQPRLDTLLDYAFNEVAQAVPAESDAQATTDAEPPPTTEGRSCANCPRYLGRPGAEWRICTCGAILCDACWGSVGLCSGCRPPLLPAQSPHEASAMGAESFIIADGASSYEAEADTASDHWADGWDSLPHATHDHGHQPARLLSLPQVVALREEIQSQHRKELHERKLRSKTLAKEQIKAGTRPPRPRAAHRVQVISLNSNCSNRLRDEVNTGDLFTDADLALVQEHKEKGEGLDRLVTWLRSKSWDPVAEEAYIKNKGLGGGSLVMSNGLGIRPLVNPPEQHRGRVCWSEVDCNGAINCASVYALSGQGAGKQLPLWCHIVQRLVSSGLPFILGGDWQLPPDELRRSDFIRLIDGEIISSGKPTNITSGSELDYFIVSRSLVGDGTSADTDPSGAFSPHVAVRLTLALARGEGSYRRLSQPKLLPIERPIGPIQTPEFLVDWQQWDKGRRPGGKDHNIDDTGQDATIDELTQEWYAGAELELLQLHGINYRDGAAHMGIGRASVVVQTTGRGRFRNVADDLGLLGQRLTWTAKALWVMVSAMASPLDSAARNGYLSLAAAMAPRARAFRRELLRKAPGMADGPLLTKLLNGLNLMGRAGLQVRGVFALIIRLKYCNYPDQLTRFRDMYDDINGSLLGVAERRRKKALKATRRWARNAADKLAHRATKRAEVSTIKSASSMKHHAGELTNQRAADMGILEWGQIWHAGPDDAQDDIIRQVEGIYGKPEVDDLPIIPLPPITCGSLRRAALRFRGDTGVGMDNIRPRHFARLSDHALAALAHLLGLFESQRKWADVVREVIEDARSKKSGGARLVGLGASLYRLWARMRFEDVRAVMEPRVERPYLAAAPGKGAVRAVFDMSLTVEAAHAQGHVAATTSYDLSQYYEHITIMEFALGARRFGLPLEITALLATLYTGPRRIRVAKAMSAVVYPTRSILAGCTFALLAIRLITIRPVEQLMRLIEERLKGWTATVHPTFYVDDGVITTTGELNAVSLLHAWVSRIVLNWVRTVLKKGIASHKSACIVSCPRLRDAIKADMQGLGIKPVLEGEMLGVDFAAGGKLRRRATQKKRGAKAVQRRGKISWLRKSGGPAVKVARQGALAEHIYGAEVIGLPPAALRDARRIHSASVGIQCGGASLTSKLALGGERFSEHDPAILYNTPPQAPPNANMGHAETSSSICQVMV